MTDRGGGEGSRPPGPPGEPARAAPGGPGGAAPWGSWQDSPLAPGDPSGPGFIGYQLKNIGDALMCLPGLALIKRAVPGARTALVARPPVAEAVRGCPAVDVVYSTGHGPGSLGLGPTLRMAASIRRGRWDAALGFDHKPRSGILALLAGQGRRLASGIPGYETPAWPWKTIQPPPPDGPGGDPRPPGLIHMTEHQARLCAAAAGVPCPGAGALPRPLLPPPSEGDRLEASRLLSRLPLGGPRVGLCLSGRQPEKCWHLLNWKGLADGLRLSRGAAFCVTGGAEDGKAASALGSMSRAPILDLTGLTPRLGTFRALFGMLDAFLTVDTGTAHLAALEGVPLMVVYTASSPALWAPQACRARLLCYDWALLRHGLPRDPPPGAPPWEACGIPGPAEALAAAESLLDGGRPGAGASGLPLL